MILQVLLADAQVTVHFRSIICLLGHLLLNTLLVHRIVEYQLDVALHQLMRGNNEYHFMFQVSQLLPIQVFKCILKRHTYIGSKTVFSEVQSRQYV